MEITDATARRQAFSMAIARTGQPSPPTMRSGNAMNSTISPAQLIEMGQPLDDHDVAAEQNPMHDRQLFEAVHVGHRRRLDADQGHLPLHQPGRQLRRNPRQRIPILRRSKPAVPIGPQQQPIARLRSYRPTRQVLDSDQFPRRESASDRAPAPAHSTRTGRSAPASRRRAQSASAHPCACRSANTA